MKFFPFEEIFQPQINKIVTNFAFEYCVTQFVYVFFQPEFGCNYINNLELFDIHALELQ